MKYKWILHLERDVYGDGEIVAEGYCNNPLSLKYLLHYEKTYQKLLSY